MTATPTKAQVEFALHNQMEDPSDDEEAGFYAGVEWLLAWQEDQRRNAALSKSSP